MTTNPAVAAGDTEPKDIAMLKRILWTLVPVIVSRIMKKRSDDQRSSDKSADKGNNDK